MNWKSIFSKRTLFNIILAVFLILYLSFVFNTGYWSDDRKYEFLRGIMLSNQWSLLDYFKFRVGVHVYDFGRFFPITTILTEGFPFLIGLKLYKTYLILIIVTASFVFRHFIKLIMGSEKMANLALILSVVLFSVQNGMPHAVFLCMGGNAVVCMIFLLICFGGIIQSSKKKRKKDTVIALVSFALSMLTYEASYPFIAVIVVLFLFEEKNIKSAMKRMAPYLVVWGVMLSIYVIFGTFTQNRNPGVHANLDLMKMVRGFIVSVTAPLPFITWYFRSGAPNDIFSFVRNIVWKDIVLVLAFLGLYLNVINKKTVWKRKTELLKLLSMGGLFIALPAVLMGISGKYQDLPIGNGYQVIIFQYFGWGCIGAAVIDFFISLLERHSERGRLLPALFHTLVIVSGCTLILVNQQDTRWTINELELYEPSISAGFDTSLRNAFQDGMAEEIGLNPESDIITMDKEYYNVYNRSAMFAEITGQVYPVYWSEELDKSMMNMRTCYGLKSGNGWVLMGALDSVKEDGIFTLEDDVWIYCDKRFDKLMKSTDQGPEFIDFTKAEEVKQGKHGMLYRFKAVKGNMNGMEPVIYQTYTLGTRVPASLTQEGKGIYIIDGFGIRENRFAWTEDRVLNLYLELEPNEYEEISAEFSLKRVFEEEQQVDVWVNGTKVHSEKLMSAGILGFRFKKPEDNIVRMRIEFPEAVSPLELGISTDGRRLGVAVKDFVFYGTVGD